MKPKQLGGINLQLFAGDAEPEETEEVVAPEATEIEEEENEDEGESFLKRKLRVMEEERELSLLKMSELETDIAETKTNLTEMKEILQAIASQTKPVRKKTVKPSANEVEDVAAKEMLIHKMKEMEDQIKQRDEKDFIKTQIAEKPYVATTVRKMKIATQNEYLRYILPIEDDLKEKESLKKLTETSRDEDVLSRYGFSIGTTTLDSKTSKRVEHAKSLGASVIDSILK